MRSLNYNSLRSEHELRAMLAEKKEKKRKKTHKKLINAATIYSGLRNASLIFGRRISAKQWLPINLAPFMRGSHNFISTSVPFPILSVIASLQFINSFHSQNKTKVICTNSFEHRNISVRRRLPSICVNV